VTFRTLLSLAWRESRFARRRLFLFLSAITLGVAALVAVKGFAANLSRGVREESKSLLGADAVLASRQPFAQRTEALIDSLARSGVEMARVTSFNSMALQPGSGAVRLVQVRAMDPGFPFYGTIETAPARAWTVFAGGRNAVVDPSLLAGLRAVVGDSIALGETRFQVIGTLQKVPGDVDIASAFAPRVYIPAAHLAETKLIGFGSRVDYSAYLRLPQPALVEALLRDHRPLFRAEHVRSQTAAQQQQGLERTLQRLTSYLGLVGVFALLLGGIGVASAMGAYIAQKVDTVAMLRCLGATARQVIGIYLVQAVAMGFAGAVLGVVLGSLVQAVLPRLVAGLLPVEVEIRPDGAAMGMGVLVGVWTAVVFALLPLLRVRRVSPLTTLRRKVEVLAAPGRDWARGLAIAALCASVYLLLALQVRSARIGAGLGVGIAVALLLLWLVASAMMRLVRALPREGIPYTARQGLANLYRPGNQTRTVVVALGFGVFLISTLILVQHNLLRPLRTEGATRADLVLWDVQEDQEPGVVELLKREGMPVLQRAAIVPMRVAAVNGREVRPRGAGAGSGEERRPGGWAARREYRSTYRDAPAGSERITAGAWWNPATVPAAGPFPISLEEGIADDLGVALGDSIVWDVQGVRIPTVVTSLRAVDWMRFEPNFFAVFPSAALRGAPQSWVVLTRADSAAARAEVQRMVVERYPNVSALDLTQVQRSLDEVIDRITAVIRFLAGFCIATGFVVLLGSVSTSRLQRVRESVLLKTLGATRRQIGSILFTEYLLFGLLAALVGVVLSVGAGWALSKWVFDLPFDAALLPLALLASAVAGLSVVVGVWASREVFDRTPMEAIREE
jgi:putative ABC transport system permease protein